MSLSLSPSECVWSYVYLSLPDSCRSVRTCFGNQVQTLNVLGIHNIGLDVAALMDFADASGIGTLRECFAKLHQLMDIVLRCVCCKVGREKRRTLALGE